LPRASKSSKKNKSRRGLGGEGPNEQVIVYTGPIIKPAEAVAQDLKVVTLFEDVAITSSAGGVVANVFTSDPTSGSPSGWANWLALYREYRVLAIEVEYCPPLFGSAPTAAGVPQEAISPLYEVEDRGLATPLASFSAAAAYASLRMHPFDERWRRQVRMSSTLEAQFGLTSASPASVYYVKWYGAPGGNAVTYGRARVAYVIQFKNRID